MPRFYYQARNVDEQLVDGEIEAETVVAAIAQLEGLGVTVEAIGFATPDTAARLANRKLPSASRSTPPRIEAPAIEPDDDAILLAQLEQTLARSRPLTPMLRAYAEELPSPQRRRTLSSICQIIERGDADAALISLAQAPEFWVPLIGNAARPGELTDVIHNFLHESHRADASRRRWWLLLAYPLFLFGFAFIVFLALAALVVPTFRSIFFDFDLELPVLTVKLLDVSAWLTSLRGGVEIVGTIAVVGAVLWGLRKRIAGWWTLFFGRSSSISRFAGFTAELHRAGLALPDALRIAGRTSHEWLARASRSLARRLDANQLGDLQPLASRLTATMLFAVTTPVSKPTRIRLLETIADCHGDRARSRLSWTQGLLGPVTVFVVGFVVAFTTLSLFIPLVDLVNNLSG
ncbi:type II secretion system F family protein [Lacipirellula sp.]|uniref:type II secretion system F family protein n=1 Tax=Lacipirellula sp. TaxID=2691419 RepID=UPI003D136391